ncbi:MAG: hypothetical protein HXY34_13845, partial [Candidatus Thorarchaeota archaeon]|nr:hypothetical protein [Candidatus Thorarchaeota archaeon]
RPQEAERDYTEALAIRRRLAERSPEQFEPFLAVTLKSLAVLYSRTNRIDDLEDVLVEYVKVLYCLNKRAQTAYSEEFSAMLRTLQGYYTQFRRLSPEEADSKIKDLLRHADPKCRGGGL